MLGKDKTPKKDQLLNEDGLDVREPYNSPELRVFGDVTDLTQTAGAKGLTDFGTVMGMKHSQ